MMQLQILLAVLLGIVAMAYTGKSGGRTYFLAPSLVQLMGELNAKYPRRSRASDGWIGDASHAARKSEHNPAWSAPGRLRGVVRAVDVTNAGINVADLIREAMQDPRVWYVISRGFIYSRTHDFAKRRYTGTNRHDHHVHISILMSVAAAFSTATWFARSVVHKAVGRTISARAIRQACRDAKAGRSVAKSRDVLATQKLLNKIRRGWGTTQIREDGVASAQFHRACLQFEKACGFKFADGILSTRGLVILVQKAKPVLPTKIGK